MAKTHLSKMTNKTESKNLETEAALIKQYLVNSKLLSTVNTKEEHAQILLENNDILQKLNANGLCFHITPQHLVIIDHDKTCIAEGWLCLDCGNFTKIKFHSLPDTKEGFVSELKEGERDDIQTQGETL